MKHLCFTRSVETNHSIFFLLTFTGCLFEDVKNADTCVEDYSPIYLQQKCTDIFQWRVF